jgi:type I restriction enzyme S subunit
MVSVSIGNGYVGPTRDILRDEGVRYLQSLHIKRNAVVFSPEYFVDPAWAARNPKSQVRLGDLLIVQTGDIGQATVVDAEFDGVHCHALIIVRPRWDVIDPEYLGWYFSSAQGYRDLKFVQTGALHPHLNCGNVRDILVPTPSLAEQKRTVARLETATSGIDALVGMTRHSIELLHEYRTSLISAAVNGQIDIPGADASEEVA